jgi:hypothetical protein
MNNYIILIILYFSSIHVGIAHEIDSVWIRADIQIKRLSSQSFLILPKQIRDYLDQHHYTIPQNYYDPNPHNVIYGHFADKKSKDIAILCSLERVSSIIIFWNGRIDSISEISKSPDLYWLQGIGDDRIGFSRIISTTSMDDHDGIDDYFEGKASIIYYYEEGKWIEYEGAD